MRECDKCGTPFTIISGIWRCPKCYEERIRKILHKDEVLLQDAKKPA